MPRLRLLLLLLACSLASCAYQRVFAWGLNRYGSAGFGFLSSSDPLSHCAPELVPALGWPILSAAGLALERVVAGYDASLAFTSNHSVLAWGRNDRGQLGLGRNDTRLTARPVLLSAAALPSGATDGCCGQYHCLLLTPDGRVLASGDGGAGQLGLGAAATSTHGVFTQVRGALSGVTVTQVVCGAAHSLALASDGALYGWGSNEEGQLGQCEAAAPPEGAAAACLRPVFEPARVPGLPAVSLVATGGGFQGGPAGEVPSGSHTLAAARDEPGALFAFGSNFYGQLGVPAAYARLSNFTLRATPSLPLDAAALPLGALPPAAAALAGSFRTLDAYVMSVRADLPRLPPGAPGARVTSFLARATRLAPLESPAAAAAQAAPVVAALAAGAGHSLALLTSGEIFGWGDNREGQVGVGYASGADAEAAFSRRAAARPLRLDAPARLTRWDLVGPDGVRRTGAADLPRVRAQVDYGSGEEGAPYGGGRFVDVRAAGGVSLALTQGGVAWVWGSNALGGLGTCGCGACAFGGAAAGSECPATAAAPAPPPPSPPPPSLPFDVTAIGLNSTGVSAGPASGPAAGPAAPPPPGADQPVAAPIAAPLEALTLPGTVDISVTCSCACPGGGNTCATAKTVTSRGVSAVLNGGVCVLQNRSGGYAYACDCESHGALHGAIAAQSAPMPLDLRGVFVRAISAGGAFFATSRSDCPEDSQGRSCSGNGQCQSDASCACDDGFVGLACQYGCKLGTAADWRKAVSYLQLGYNGLYPGGALNTSAGDSNMTGLLCSGNGNCSSSGGGCVCQAGWAGDHCQLPCYRDDLRRPCAGHGACVLDPLISPMPYCACEHYSGAEACAAAGLALRPGGVCAWYDASLGFAACQEQGQCGICDSEAPRARAAAAALAAAALVLLAVLC